MNEKPRALLGTVNPDREKELTSALEGEGYDVTKARSVQAMLDSMDILSSPPDSPPRRRFKWYIMDANLGLPGDGTYFPAQTIYQHVKSQVEQGLSNFMALTGREDVLRKVREKGMPCVLYVPDKPDLTELVGMIRQSQ